MARPRCVAWAYSDTSTAPAPRARLIDVEGPLFDLARAQGERHRRRAAMCRHYSEAGYAVIASVLMEYLRVAVDLALEHKSCGINRVRRDDLRNTKSGGRG